jgi:hypothetical protein
MALRASDAARLSQSVLRKTPKPQMKKPNHKLLRLSISLMSKANWANQSPAFFSCFQGADSWIIAIPSSRIVERMNARFGMPKGDELEI